MKRTNVAILILLCFCATGLASCYGSGMGPAKGWSGVVSDDGLLYAGTADGRVVAVDSAAGSLVWSYAIPAPAGGAGCGTASGSMGASSVGCGQAAPSTTIYGTPVVLGDMIYVGVYTGKVLALSGEARGQDLVFPQKRYGEWEWECPTTNAGAVGSCGQTPKSSAIVGRLLVDDDSLYVSSSNGRVYSLDREFGDLNWESEVLDEKLWTSPAKQGNSIYVSTYDGHVYGLSAESGELLPWAFESELGFASAPVVYGDIILVGSFDRRLYALKIGAADPLWSIAGQEWFWGAPVVVDGIVYAGCLDGKVYAVEAATGSGRWEFDTGCPVVSSPVVTGRSLIVADEDGNLHILESGAQEAVQLRTVAIGTTVRGGIWAEGDTAYVRGQNDTLYAVDIERGRVVWELPLAGEQ